MVQSDQDVLSKVKRLRSTDVTQNWTGYPGHSVLTLLLRVVLDGHIVGLTEELVVEDALGEYEPVPLLLPQPDLCEQTWIISEKMRIQTRLLRDNKK